MCKYWVSKVPPGSPGHSGTPLLETHWTRDAPPLLLPAPSPGCPASSAKWGAGSISSVSTRCCWAQHTRQNRCLGQANAGARTDPDVKIVTTLFPLFPAPTPFLLSHPFPCCGFLLAAFISRDMHACKQRDFLAWAVLQLPSKMDKPTHVSKGVEDREGETQPLAADIFPKQAKPQSEAR